MKSRILDKMKFELKRGEVKGFEQKAFPPVVAHSARISRFKNDLKESYRGHWLQTNEVLKLHTYIFNPYIPEVQIVHNRSPETTNY